MWPLLTVPRVVALTVAFALIVAALLWRSVTNDHEHALAAWDTRLTTSAEYRQHWLNYWFEDRLADARVVAGFPAVAAALRQPLVDDRIVPPPTEGDAHLHQDVAAMLADPNTAGIVAIDPHGRMVFSEGAVTIPPSLLADFAADPRPVRDLTIAGRTLLAFSVPVHAAGARIGSVVLLSDPNKRLWPLLSLEGVPTSTGEVLIVRREGDSVIFLSPVRHAAQGTPLRVPLDTPGMAARAAVTGRATFGEFRDYRGEPILAATRPLAIEGWGLVRKVDQAEALAGFRRAVRRSSLMSAFALIAFGAILFALSRRQQTRILDTALAEERRLRAVEERYRQLLDQADDILLVLAPGGPLLDANRRAEEAYGYTRDELLELSAADLRDPESPAPPIPEVLARAEQRGIVIESVHRRKDGSRLPVEISLVGVDLSGERVIVATVRDITERRQASDLLRASEARFRALFDHAAVAMCLLDQDGVIVEVNDASCKFIGLPRDRLLGTAFTAYTHPDDLDLTRQRFDALLRGEIESYVLEKRYVMADSRQPWGQVSAALIRDAAGRPRYVSAVVVDITEQKEAADAILRANADLEARVAQRTAALEEANAELSAFNYSVSHDLRAPLRHIEGFIRILEEDYAATLPPEGRHYLERVRAGSVRINQLVDALLRLVRVGRTEMQTRTINLGELARATFDELRHHDNGHPVDFVVGPLPRVSGDPVLLRELLDNLIGNAIKFTRPAASARIEVGTEERDGRDVFYVRDNGVGFDTAHAERLFRVFQRLHSSDQFEGTGIGLSIVKRIVEKHGGRVWAESALGAGATFYFTLAPADAGE